MTLIEWHRFILENKIKENYKQMKEADEIDSKIDNSGRVILH